MRGKTAGSGRAAIADPSQPRSAASAARFTCRVPELDFRPTLKPAHARRLWPLSGADLLLPPIAMSAPETSRLSQTVLKALQAGPPSGDVTSRLKNGDRPGEARPLQGEPGEPSGKR